MKYLYKYPQREFPYRGPGRDQPRPVARGVRVRAARHGRVRRRPVLRRVRGVREGRARRTCSSGSRSTTAGRKRRGSACCRRCGSATRGRGATTTPKPSLRAVGRRASIQATHHGARRRTGCRCEGAPELLFTENESNAARLWGQPNAVAVREGRVPRLRRVGPARRGESRARTGTKAAAHYALEVPAGGSQTLRLRLVDARRPPSPSPTSTRLRAAASPTPTSSTSGSRRRRSPRTSGACIARRWPACCGASSSTTSTSSGG